MRESVNIPNKPSDVKWTSEQWEAIYAGGNDILVAAAAGSGKTAILVERIIERVLAQNNPISIDQLLVLTFTNAAAAEMRNRLTEVLEKKLQENPHNSHILRQLSLLNLAQISTFHAFCIEVVRSNFHYVDCEPNFKIVSEMERSLLFEEALQQLLEMEYSKKNNEIFLRIVNSFAGDRNDDNLLKILESLLTYAEAQPNPLLWLQTLTHSYPNKNVTTMEEFPFFSLVKNTVIFSLEEVIQQLETAYSYCELPEAPEVLLNILAKEISAVNSFRDYVLNNDWVSIKEYVLKTEFFQKRLPAIKTGTCSQGIKESITLLRNKSKKTLAATISNYFEREVEDFRDELISMESLVSYLGVLTTHLREIFRTLKKERGLVDFNDLEHLALSILGKANEKGEIKPTEIALSYKEKFAEILIDEYQDTNHVQEALLNCIKHNKGNLFMVGDVKQSIYRFRLADPTLFMEKYNRFSKLKNDGIKIDLNKNFRSRNEVIAGINYIFRNLLDNEVGELTYSDEAALYNGANYPKRSEEVSNAIQLNLIEKNSEDDEEDVTTPRLEALAMGKLIKELVGNYPVFDAKKNSYRPCEWSDIVILHRTKSWYTECVNVFQDLEIPIYAKTKAGYFETIEIRIMLALLQVIDNPYQDIPLVSILRSPIVGLNSIDLGEIRIVDTDIPFYDALKKYKGFGKDNKIRATVADFLQKLQLWQKMARHKSVSELIWIIYRETNYLDYVSGLFGGNQARSNLLGFYHRAYEFEQSTFRGIHRFVRFINWMRERGDDLGEVSSIGEQENLVRLISVHASKGLEFPIVFLAGLGREFNLRDIKNNYIIDSKYGFVTDYLDGTERMKRKSLFTTALGNERRKQLLSEEMRIWYVAMTRAKEKLYLFGTVNKIESEISKWSQFVNSDEWVLPAWYRANAKCPLDWFGAALYRHRDGNYFLQNNVEVGEMPLEKRENHLYYDESTWQLVTEKIENLKEPVKVFTNEQSKLLPCIKAVKKITIASDYKEEIWSQMDWNYPYEKTAGYRAKKSITSLVKDTSYVNLEELLNPVQIEKLSLELNSEEDESPLKKGTIIHLVLENVPLNSKVTKATIERTVSDMLEKKLITQNDIDLIPFTEIATFFNSDLGERIISSKKVWRELPFTLYIPLGELELENEISSGEEKLFIQGTVDCLFLTEENELVLVDYKTGIFPDENSKWGQEKIDQYKKQVNYYSLAIERITKKRVVERYLYFFTKAKQITCD